MSNMKNRLAEYVEQAREAIECYPDERFEVTWLDAVPFDKDGNPTGEKNEWVINRGNYVVADDFDTEQEAQEVLDVIEGELDADILEQTNDNGSLLNPDTITYCNACQEHVEKEVESCPSCGSMDVDHIEG